MTLKYLSDVRKISSVMEGSFGVDEGRLMLVGK